MTSRRDARALFCLTGLLLTGGFLPSEPIDLLIRGLGMPDFPILSIEDDKGWYALAAAPLRPWLQPVLKYEWFDRGGIALAAQPRTTRRRCRSERSIPLTSSRVPRT